MSATLDPFALGLSQDGWAGVAVGILGVLVAVVLFVYSRRTKRLSYAEVSNRVLAPSAKRVGVEVRFEGHALEEPRVVLWRMVNDGATAITAADFEEPLRLVVPQARVITAEVTWTRPREFSPTVAIAGGSEVTVDPLLINSRDAVEVQLLVDGPASRVDVQSRLNGISRVGRVKLAQTSWGEPWEVKPWEVALGLLPGLAVAAIAVVAWQNAGVGWKITAGVLFILGAVVYPWRFNRLRRRSQLFLGN